MELRRFRDWLEREQLGYWQMQVKRRHEAMMMARTELHRRKITQANSDAVSDTEQKEALREWQRKLHAAEQKLELVKRLIPQLHHAIADYHAHSQPLGDHLTGGFEVSLARLSRMIESLEAYLTMAPPSTASASTHSEPGAFARSGVEKESDIDPATGSFQTPDAESRGSRSPDDAPSASITTFPGGSAPQEDPS
jgi:hypothetical protein